MLPLQLHTSSHYDRRLSQEVLAPVRAIVFDEGGHQCRPQAPTEPQNKVMIDNSRNQVNEPFRGNCDDESLVRVSPVMSTGHITLIIGAHFRHHEKCGLAFIFRQELGKIKCFHVLDVHLVEG